MKRTLITILLTLAAAGGVVAAALGFAALHAGTWLAQPAQPPTAQRLGRTVAEHWRPALGVLRAGLAVTGALNQHGEVLPVGGINEKIEGYFRVCAAAGLDGGVPVETLLDIQQRLPQE